MILSLRNMVTAATAEQKQKQKTMAKQFMHNHIHS